MKDTTLASQARDRHPEESGADIDLSALFRAIVALVRQNVLIIAGIVFGVVILGVVLTLLQTPQYQASTQIVIEDQADQIIEGTDLQKAVSSTETERFLQTQLSVIRSRALATYVVDGAKLANDASFFADLGGEMPSEVTMPGRTLKEERQRLAVELLMEALQVSIPEESRIAVLTITSRSPQRSTRLANFYAERFIEYNLNQKYESSSYARQFLADQLEEARAKLTQSERDLNQYARAAGLIRVSSGGESGQQEAALSVTNNQLIELNNSAAQATAERIAAQDRWKAFSSQPALSIPEVTSNASVMQLVTAKAAEEASLAEQLATRKDDYATVRAKRAQVAELGRRIDVITNSIKRSAQLNYQASLEKENSLLKTVDQLRDAALVEQDRGVQYSVLKRVADTNRALYESLLSRFNQLNASAGSQSNNVAIVDRAIEPVKPSSPNLLLNIFLAFTLGLLCAAAFVTLRHLLDDAIRSPDDVESKLGLSLLGLIPLRKDENIDEELTDRRSSVSEAYRSLVTNLSYSTSTGLPRVLIVTSAREGEGKSTTARAIATDIAALGKRTILVDVDLRRPTLHRAMHDTSNAGLTSFLTGQKTFDEVVHPASSVSPSLSYVTALPTPPDPSLILAGEGIGTFVNEARSRYDVVVLDCPPLLGLSDVPLVARVADGVLFVIDATSFHRGAIKSALRRLSLINAKILGVALNRFSPKSGSDDYAYYAEGYYTYGNDKPGKT